MKIGDMRVSLDKKKRKWSRDVLRLNYDFNNYEMVKLAGICLTAVTRDSSLPGVYK